MTQSQRKPEAEILIEGRGLGKMYRTYSSARDRFSQFFNRGTVSEDRKFWALRDVTFDIRRGEAVGIVGRNGAGKSTLLQIVTGTLAPTTGSVHVTGRIAALLQLGSGFNPEFTGRENVFLNGAILGFTRKQVLDRMPEIVDFAEIGHFIDQPVKNYSSGMTMRLAFAVSACLEPEVLIVDEALAVGDALFQRKCYARLDAFIAKGGALLFVSHSLETVKRLCDRAIYLENGCLRAIGQPNEVVSKYELDMDRMQRSGTLSIANTETHQDYGNRLATIRDCWLEDIHGTKIEAIPSGQPFTWCYDVDVHKVVSGLSFGMKIVNLEGLALYATNSAMLGVPHQAPSAGSNISVRFQIRENNLTAGVYFLSAGVSQSVDGKENFVHRKVDCAQLIIQQPDEVQHAGMLDLKALVEVK